MRDQIVAGNWKMNKDLNQATALVEEIQSLMMNPVEADKVIVAPPYTYLAQTAAKAAEVPGLFVAGQNCHQEMSGAYTGEISATILKSLGVDYVILGHSERREYFGESNQLLALKVKAALGQDLIPIFCCGEPLSIREAGEQQKYVNQQLTESLFQLEADDLRRLVIAYEPIWAIGTGRTASAEQAQQMHASIRKHLASKYGAEVANHLPILYGGSCKPSNAKEIFAGEDVDGGLIGGASLNANDFIAIANSL
ncbi:MAG: triosephosphate isomerase [Cyclobacteriaceae bacterium]|nr:MAG: triosephosphate isomerase [Cyclobacteriaceae bacterium]